MSVSLVKDQVEPLGERRPADTLPPPTWVEDNDAKLPPAAACGLLLKARNGTNRLPIDLDDPTIMTAQSCTLTLIKLLTTGIRGGLEVGPIPQLPLGIRPRVPPGPQEVEIIGTHRPESHIHCASLPWPRLETSGFFVSRPDGENAAAPRPGRPELHVEPRFDDVSLQKHLLIRE